MRRRVLLGVAVVGVALASGQLSASAGDQSAVSAYVQANYRYVQAQATNAARSLAAMSALLRRVRHECPGAAKGAPGAAHVEDATLGTEILGAVLVSAAGPDERAAARFVRTAGRLSWTGTRLARAVRAYLRKLDVELSLAVPNLCSDFKSWVASGFQTLPSSTVRFARRVEAIMAGPEEVDPGLMAQYEDSRDRTLAGRIDRISQQLAKRIGLRPLQVGAEIRLALS